MKEAFWVTNISKRNVSLADLNLTIKAYSTVNLLDSRHYYYSLDQLKKSASSGSLFKKQKLVVVRQNAPVINKKTILVNKDAVIPTRERSLYKITEEFYEELNVSDEEFAKENAELADDV